MLKFLKALTGARSRTGMQSPPPKDFIDRIGRAAVHAAHDPDGKILLYAEVEDGVLVAELFSQHSPTSVRFRFAPEDLKSLIYKFWQGEPDPHRRWATMSFVIEAGSFLISWEYLDALDPEQDLAVRRRKAVEAQFARAQVDDSNPY